MYCHGVGLYCPPCDSNYCPPSSKSHTMATFWKENLILRCKYFWSSKMFCIFSKFLVKIFLISKKWWKCSNIFVKPMICVLNGCYTWVSWVSTVLYVLLEKFKVAILYLLYCFQKLAGLYCTASKKESSVLQVKSVYCMFCGIQIQNTKYNNQPKDKKGQPPPYKVP